MYMYSYYSCMYSYISYATVCVYIRVRIVFTRCVLRQVNAFLQVKLDKSAGKPSKVIHLRNIPSEVSEAEIIHLGIPFGRVTNVLVLKGKNQVNLSHLVAEIRSRRRALV